MLSLERLPPAPFSPSPQGFGPSGGFRDPFREHSLPMPATPLETYLLKAGYSKAQRNLAQFARRYGVPSYELSRMLNHQAAGQPYRNYRMICRTTAGIEHELHTALDPRHLFAPETSQECHG